jgi:hypothetical protein
METRIQQFVPKDLKLLSLNARYLPKEQYGRLVENVKRDGKLTSVPFACRNDDGSYLVLSGNHRVMAAIDAGLESIEVMTTDDPLSETQRVAIQLSHNSIAGQDDPAVLTQLFEKLEDVDWRLYSGLDDKTLDLLMKVEPIAPIDAPLEYKSVNLIFLPSSLDEAKKSLDEAKSMSKTDETWLALGTEYQRWLTNIDDAAGSAGVSNLAIALQVIFDVFEHHKADLGELWDNDGADPHAWVPLVGMTGRTSIPVIEGRTLKKAIERIVGQEKVNVKKPWEALAYMADFYLQHEKEK